MKLTVDKRFVKAGNVVEITWDAEGATSPRIVMHTGKRESTLSVPSSGSKRFRLKGVKGSHWIGLKVWEGNEEKTIKHRVFVYGKAPENDAFEYMDRQDNWLSRIKNYFKRWWSMFTPEKKRLYILLLLLLAYQTMFSLALFTVAQILFTAIIFWLFWQIIKR